MMLVLGSETFQARFCKCQTGKPSKARSCNFINCTFYKDVAYYIEIPTFVCFAVTRIA